jgi:hypothetical protein
MNGDPILDEIRRHREAVALASNYDLHAICEALRDRQKRAGRDVVAFPPRQANIETTTSTGQPLKPDPAVTFSG